MTDNEKYLVRLDIIKTLINNGFETNSEKLIQESEKIFQFVMDKQK